VRGRELIRVAEELARGNANEPRARSAINRAYYAAYTELSHFVAIRGYTHSPQRGSHRRTWEYIQDMPEQDRHRRAEKRAIASQGLLLKDHRTKADYQPSSRIGRYDATEAVRSAKGIVRALDRLTP
jgi:hypothetical protein